MKRLLISFLSGAALASAWAADASLQRCRELRDPAARLACYDAIPLVTVPGAASSPAAVVPPPPPAATFGLESRPTPSNLPAPLPFIESAIDGPFDGWLPRSQLKLTNGQVWEIADGSSAAYTLKSPKVKVSRGVSGSFFMAIEGVAQTPRVRRIK